MVTISFQTILDDLQNDEKFQIFQLEFPNYKKELTEIKTNPNCFGCISKNFTTLFSNKEEVEKKLKLIYGSVCNIDLTLPTPPPQPRFNMKTEVIEVNVEEYSTWFNENVTMTPEKRIQTYSTFYNPDTKKVVVSMVQMVMVK
jgi:hypothetical protein